MTAPAHLPPRPASRRFTPLVFSLRSGSLPLIQSDSAILKGSTSVPRCGTRQVPLWIEPFDVRRTFQPHHRTWLFLDHIFTLDILSLKPREGYVGFQRTTIRWI